MSKGPSLDEVVDGFREQEGNSRRCRHATRLSKREQKIFTWLKELQRRRKGVE